MKPKIKSFTSLFVVLFVLAANFATPQVARAATLTVTNNNDSGPGSLRDAIASANDGAIITFDSSLSGQTITLTSTLTINNGLTIDGSSLASPITISGADTYRVFSITSSTMVTLNTLIIANGFASDTGAGIYSDSPLIVTNSTLRNNQVSSTGLFARGGAIYNQNGTLTVTNSTFSGNSAVVTTSSFIGSAFGGAIYNLNGLVTIANSTFSNNSVTATVTGDYAASEADGGAISNSSALTVTNSTFSGNGAVATATGNGSGTSNLGGGIFSGNASTVNLFNTIIANSLNGDCFSESGVVSETNNLIEDTGSNACGLMDGTNGDIIGSDPNLSPLASNGGVTQTMALLTGSPAVDAGDNASCPATDQRGVTRPQGLGCDIGAYEYDTQVFSDVPLTYWATNFIDRLYASGITGGCSTSPLMYCPETSVTRAQMAVFLLRGEHGSTYTPPAATGAVFGDVPLGYWADAWIEQLAAEGITGGCGNGNYCPDTPVTRDQMAVFLLRTKHGSAYTPPTPTGVFTDVPTDHWAAAWIEQLAAEGITGGCGSGNYCPAVVVTRAQMAVFLVRTFNLP